MPIIDTLARIHPVTARAHARERLHRRRDTREAAATRHAALDDAITRLGITTTDLPHTRSALTVWESAPHLSSTGNRILLAGVTGAAMFAIDKYVAPPLVDLAMNALGTVAPDFAHQANPALEGMNNGEPWQFSAATMMGQAVVLAVPLAVAALFLLLLSYAVASRHPRWPYSLVDETAKALAQCADLYEAQLTDLRTSSRKVDRRSRAVEQHVLDAYRSSRTIPRRSPRRAPARQHGQLVAAALRRQLTQIDVDPRQGVQDYAALVAEVGERYAEGRVSSLLPEEKLAGLTPPSPALTTFRESLHIAGGIVAAALAAVAAAALLPKLGFIPEDLSPWLIASAAAVAGILTAGWHRVARLIPFFGP
ncbi:hypothetical protein [Streptomyces sp. NPDC002215]|uniref:hypothetical protein n=1 Tax=Streptomyces sp. NPDC002215 TaxID=3154412 RepID=UPI003323E871